MFYIGYLRNYDALKNLISKAKIGLLNFLCGLAVMPQFPESGCISADE